MKRSSILAEFHWVPSPNKQPWPSECDFQKSHLRICSGPLIYEPGYFLFVREKADDWLYSRYRPDFWCFGCGRFFEVATNGTVTSTHWIKCLLINKTSDWHIEIVNPSAKQWSAKILTRIQMKYFCLPEWVFDKNQDGSGVSLPSCPPVSYGGLFVDSEAH